MVVMVVVSLMVGGGNEFVAFVVIMMVGVTCVSFGKLFFGPLFNHDFP
jgi:hypothetical protein